MSIKNILYKLGKYLTCKYAPSIEQSEPSSSNLPNSNTISSDIKVCLDIDSLEKENINVFTPIYIPKDFDDCYYFMSDIVCGNNQNPNPIEALALFTLISVYSFQYETVANAETNYISGSRMQTVDSIIYTSFILRAICINNSKKTLGQHIFSDKYINIIKKSLHSNMLTDLSSDLVDEIFNERARLYDTCFTESQDLDATLDLYISIIQQDIILNGYKPFIGKLEKGLDESILKDLISHLFAYYHTLSITGQRSIFDVINNFINVT